MAFNFRAKNKNEIIKKNKKVFLLDQVAEIFEYFQNKYKETIILDPNTSFSKIKIPRILSDTKI